MEAKPTTQIVETKRVEDKHHVTVARGPNVPHEPAAPNAELQNTQLECQALEETPVDLGAQFFTRATQALEHRDYPDYPGFVTSLLEAVKHGNKQAIELRKECIKGKGRSNAAAIFAFALGYLRGEILKRNYDRGFRLLHHCVTVRYGPAQVYYSECSEHPTQQAEGTYAMSRAYLDLSKYSDLVRKNFARGVKLLQEAVRGGNKDAEVEYQNSVDRNLRNLPNHFLRRVDKFNGKSTIGVKRFVEKAWEQKVEIVEPAQWVTEEELERNLTKGLGQQGNVLGKKYWYKAEELMALGKTVEAFLGHFLSISALSPLRLSGAVGRKRIITQLCADGFDSAELLDDAAEVVAQVLPNIELFAENLMAATGVNEWLSQKKYKLDCVQGYTDFEGSTRENDLFIVEVKFSDPQPGTQYDMIEKGQLLWYNMMALQGTPNPKRVTMIYANFRNGVFKAGRYGHFKRVED
ncbi:hypothetical protein HDU93_008650 [Gonapodya sp. JEL0774]|nr:hypothetical protein HDU93_008650 [Gonapodya sp. JEL0774]